MNTNELYSILNIIFKGNKINYNVLPCDKLENVDVNKFPIYLIVNDEPSNMEGNHWTAICIKNKRGPIEFFCSYGLGVNTYRKYFINFINKFKAKILENTIPLQSIGSSVCGLYATYFLYKRYKGCCVMSIYCGFSKNNKNNDKIVKNVVKNLLFKFKNCKYKNNEINQICTKF